MNAITQLANEDTERAAAINAKIPAGDPPVRSFSFQAADIFPVAVAIMKAIRKGDTSFMKELIDVKKLESLDAAKGCLAGIKRLPEEGFAALDKPRSQCTPEERAVRIQVRTKARQLINRALKVHAKSPLDVHLVDPDPERWGE